MGSGPSILPGMDAIGYSYDVLGKYANIESCRWKIFDFGAPDTEFTYDGKTYVYPDAANLQIINISQAQDEIVAGESRTSYVKSLNSVTKISGNYGFFEGSLETDFSSEQNETTDNAFSTVRYVSKFWRMSIPSEIDRRFITPNFLKDLEGPAALAPNDFFERYGTHYVASFTVGGRADFNSTTSSTTFSSVQALSVAAEMSYKSINGSITASEKIKYQTQIDTFNSNSISTSLTQGGSTKLGAIILNGPQAFSDWVSSIETNPVMVDFDQDSLRPLWTLCQDSARRAELEAAYPTFMMFHLEYQMTMALVACGTDQGSGAHEDVAFFKPGGLGDGYYWVGQFAQSQYGSPVAGAAVLIVKPNRASALARPARFELVWTDQGSGRSNDYSLWRPIPPTDYVALGHIARFNVTNYDPPSGAEIENFRCVHKSLVTNGANTGAQIWNDSGTGARQDGAIWPIVPIDPTTGLAGGTFLATDSHNPPQNPVQTVSCLRLDMCKPG